MNTVCKISAVWHVMLVINQASFGKLENVAWSYNREVDGGPDTWSHSYKDCGGVMQSPIDVVSSKVIYDSNLQHFDLSEYSNTDGVNMTLENVHGHTAQVTLTGKEIFLRGGSLPDTYKLEQFHFHWGNSQKQGSEHALDGRFYPMEIHFVHSQRSLLNISAAISHPHGLAVIAFFYQIGNKNDKYDQLLQYFKNITHPEQQLHIPTFSVADLLPPGTKADYFRYYGSTTTPPCYESVIWSIATDVIEISEEQINIFRSLFDEKSEKLMNDFRPTQNLNQRSVLSTINNQPDCVQRGGKGNGVPLVLPKTTTTIMLLVICIYLFML